MLSGGVSEFELIARYFAPLARGFPGAFSLLDDVALIAPLPGHELAAKTDAIVGGVHFLPDDPPELIARKALRVNLSDLAAKGAVPRAYMVDLMLPEATSEQWVADFARGLAEDQEEYGVHLIGGDTNATRGPAAIAVMAFGDVPAGRMIKRSGARAGDKVFVTGTIGDAVLGLEALRGEVPELDANATAFVIDRYRLPRPRVGLGAKLTGLVNAAIDVSDGLVADLGHICEMSGLAALIDAPSVPLSTAARAAVAKRPGRIETLLTGGDDYEILFTAGPNSTGALMELSRVLNVPITVIGQMHSPSEGVQGKVTVLDERGRRLVFEREGWTHF